MHSVAAHHTVLPETAYSKVFQIFLNTKDLSAAVHNKHTNQKMLIENS